MDRRAGDQRGDEEQLAADPVEVRGVVYEYEE